jgi:hypothetical protein
MKVAPARTRATTCGAFTAPAVLGGLDELERHGEPGGSGAGTAGDLGPVPNGGESRLDGVGCAQMNPVLGGVVVEREQLAEVVGDLRCGLGELRSNRRLRTPPRRRVHAGGPRRSRSRPGPSSHRDARTSVARRERWRSCGTNSAALWPAGTPPVARPRTRVRRRPSPGPERASHAGRSHAASPPTPGTNALPQGKSGSRLQW